MANSLYTRLKNAWNIFRSRDDVNPDGPYPKTDAYQSVISSGSFRPDRARFSRGNERSIVTAVYNRIALDVAAIDLKHIDTDDNGRYISEHDSGLNTCLTLEANIDQTARAFKQDAVISMLDEGVVALVPTDTISDPNKGTYDIVAMRTGRITGWMPYSVKVDVYNERTGRRQEVTCDKANVAIIENPLYAVINEPNSTMQRLIRKLNLLDYIDEQSGNGKFNLIVQLPWAVKSDMQRERSDQRLADVERQLNNNKYGIAYIGATEKVTQLNRPLDNNLLTQIESLTNQLYSQLGITQEIMNGTADEQAMLNYTNRTVEPIVSAIVDEMKRKFLTKTARTQRQSIAFFKDPFKLVPVANIAEIADKFTRNEILSPNEVRQVIGMKPAADPKADELRNRNISESAAQQEGAVQNVENNEEEVNGQNG